MKEMELQARAPWRKRRRGNSAISALTRVDTVLEEVKMVG